MTDPSDPLDSSSEPSPLPLTPTSPSAPQGGSEAVVRSQPASSKGDKIGADGTWAGVEPPGGDTPLLADRRARLEQQRHVNSQQSRLLVGLGILIVFTMLVVFAGPWVGAVSEDFAQSIAQMVLPALLTFGGAIVGTLFTGSNTDDTQKKI